jgi:hypothetical protein
MPVLAENPLSSAEVSVEYASAEYEIRGVNVSVWVEVAVETEVAVEVEVLVNVVVLPETEAAPMTS